MEHAVQSGPVLEANAEGEVRRATFLAQASALLGASLDYETTLDQVARLAVPALADWAAVDIAVAEGDVRQLAVAHLEPEGVAVAHELRRRYPIDPDQPSAILDALRTGRPVFVPTVDDAMLCAVARDAEHLGLLRRLAFTSLIVVPLLARGRPLGTISLATSGTRLPFGEEDLALAEELGRRAGTAIDNAQLYAEAQHARGVAERLQAVTAALSGAVTPAQVVQAIVEQGMASFGVDAGSVWTLEDDRRTFALLGYTGYAAESESQHTRVPFESAGPLAEAVRAGDLVAVESPEELVARWPHLAASQAQSGDAATVAVPLLLDDRLLGVLYLAFRSPRRFSREDRSFLVTLARQCAQALERGRLYEQERAARERQRFLAEAGSVLAASLDLAATLQSAARLAVPVFADWCAIYEVVEGGRLHRAAIAHADPGMEARMRGVFSYALHMGMDVPLVRAARDLRTELNPAPPTLPDDLFADAEQARAVHDLTPASSLVVPLLARERSLGVVGYFRQGGRPCFTVDDQALAEELGRRVALAIDNARLYHEAQEAIRIRNHFFTVASHELKTPLTSLLASAQLLQRRVERDGTLQQRDRQTLALLVDQAGRQRRLVEDLLDLSRLQAGQLAITVAPVDLAGLVRRIVAEGSSVEGVSLSVAVPDEPLIVEGDELRLGQVLQNLVQNAIKYSPDGGAITVRLERSGEQAVLSVSDEGIGIPEESLPYLFDRFYRAPNVEPLAASGLGVGLYVVKEIIGRHGGQVTVESAVGRGSTFRVYLPLAEAMAADATGGGW